MKATRRDVECMFLNLVRTMKASSGLENGQYLLAWQGQRCRIERVSGKGRSVPFLHTWLRKQEAVDMFWFAAQAIDLAQEEAK